MVNHTRIGMANSTVSTGKSKLLNRAIPPTMILGAYQTFENTEAIIPGRVTSGAGKVNVIFLVWVGIRAVPNISRLLLGITCLLTNLGD